MIAKTLIFTTCYNEKDNIGPLLDQIFAAAPSADVLVVDDSSPDGTWDVIQQRRRQYPRLFAVKRPGKRGIGSAHKYALLYAMREKYDTLLTMDADFSHQPASIPALLAQGGPNVFVTGSRYCEGGRSDYKGYRHYVSVLGNVVARALLGLKIKELTTYFRVFDVESLRRLPLRRIKSEGYSYGVQLVYYIRKCGAELREVPIHFVDRLHGASKIPKMQIVLSVLDLLRMAAKRVFIMRDLAPDVLVDDACSSCGDRVLTMRHAGSHWDPSTKSAAAFQCTAVGSRSYPPVYTCLNCGLRQVPASLIPPRLEQLYEDVVDSDYLGNIEVRRQQFRRCFDRIAEWLPKSDGSLLEVGAYCGLFLKEAGDRGYQADGVEPSRWAADYARQTTGVNVLPGFLAENRSQLRRRYDAVVSWDVLEHVRNPVQFVRECGDMLDPGGIFLFSTLDVKSWLPRLLGRRWPWLMDMHIQYFDVRSVEDVLRCGGFELVKAEPYTHYAWARYILERGSRVFPRWAQGLPILMSKIVPRKLMIPVAFGDIKLYVARKLATPAAAAGAEPAVAVALNEPATAHTHAA